MRQIFKTVSLEKYQSIIYVNSNVEIMLKVRVFSVIEVGRYTFEIDKETLSSLIKKQYKLSLYLVTYIHP